MSFFAILCALLAEQVRPLPRGSALREGVRMWADWIHRNVDAGKPQSAALAWALAATVPALLALVVHVSLEWGLGWPFAVAWNVAVLYLTLGFRQFSHPFTEIREALDAGDEALAKSLLARWRRIDPQDLPQTELLRQVIEYSVLCAHRHVFGVLAWYAVLAAFGLGPAGAVLYRASEFLRRHWGAAAREGRLESASAALQRISLDMWRRIDWVPARVTALGFAVVGSFEDAIDGWRRQANDCPGDNDGLMLAATAGALNVRLATEQDQTHWREPQPAHLVQLVGLVWRSVVVWMLLLALLTLAHLLG